MEGHASIGWAGEAEDGGRDGAGELENLGWTRSQTIPSRILSRVVTYWGDDPRRQGGPIVDEKEVLDG